jgi:hypothetical protein
MQKRDTPPPLSLSLLACTPLLRPPHRVFVHCALCIVPPLILPVLNLSTLLVHHNTRSLVHLHCYLELDTQSQFLQSTSIRSAEIKHTVAKIGGNPPGGDVSV